MVEDKNGHGDGRGVFGVDWYFGDDVVASGRSETKDAVQILRSADDTKSPIGDDNAHIAAAVAPTS
jgi:hypothetical protein